MGYSPKWVRENLGISDDTIKYYESKKLISKVNTRNPCNNYRDFTEKDIERIWGIKLLRGLGFSADEIYEFDNNHNYNFYDAISKKVKELEKRYDELRANLGFAKTIKMTGQVPSVTKLGIMKFDDFIEFSRQNWNVFNDPKGAKYLNVVDAILTDRATDEGKEKIFDNFMEFLGATEAEELPKIITTTGYIKVVINMMHLGFQSNTVQSVIKCFYEYNLNLLEPIDKANYTPIMFANRYIPLFIDSDVARINERNYGKDCCMFVAKSIAYFAQKKQY